MFHFSSVWWDHLAVWLLRDSSCLHILLLPTQQYFMSILICPFLCTWWWIYLGQTLRRVRWACLQLQLCIAKLHSKEPLCIYISSSHVWDLLSPHPHQSQCYQVYQLSHTWQIWNTISLQFKIFLITNETKFLLSFL